MRLDKESQYGYNRYLDYLHVKASEAFTLRIEAEEKIKQEKAVEIAKSLFNTNLSNEDIAKHNGLKLEQIEQLKKEKY
jgi:hypothetical protein